MITIYSGVGSGKNHWVTTLADRGFNILLITSRAATANAQAKKMHANRYIDLDELHFENNKVFGRPSNAVVVCTNSGIEKFVKHRYKEEDPKTHLWNYFDFIILDEAHSLSADAVFADAPFHVEMFIRWAIKHNENCKVVFMTGTPEPIEWMFSEKDLNDDRFNSINCFSACNHVEPEEVMLISKESVLWPIVNYLKEGKRIIYFSQSIKNIGRLVRDLTDRGIPEEEIGISYSDRSRDNLFSSALVEKIKTIKASLLDYERIPDEIKIFITTSQNKEGVNIQNDDIKVMVAESTQRSELVQMAGRVRPGLETLAILYDKPNYTKPISLLDELFSKHCMSGVQESIRQYCSENPDYEEDETIQYVETCFKNIRYSPFHKEFVEYRGRANGIRQYLEDSKNLKQYISNWVDRCYTDGESAENRLTYFPQGKTGREKFTEWFPYSEICDPYLPSTEKSAMPAIIKTVQEYLEAHHYIGRKITKNDKDTITNTMNDILVSFDFRKESISFPIKNLGPFLKKCNLELKVEGKHNGENWIIQKR